MIVHTISEPNEKQKLFLLARKKIVGYGGARGGGKSWVLRLKAKLLALRYAGIRQCLVRKTYRELEENHIWELRKMLLGIARYNSSKKTFIFNNGSTLTLQYCAKDADIDNFQGVEYDVVFIDEATQLSEFQIKQIMASVRGVNEFPKRIYLTCNPGGQGHGYIKRIFIDRNYTEGEDPNDYEFIQSLVDDNYALMQMQPDYKKQLELLPERLKKAWLYGDWNIFEGQFFEDFVDDPKHYEDRQFTHVIEPFEIPSHWKIYRSYDFGYSKPFSVAWWAVDTDGVIYRILEYYGCTKEANVGVKLTADQQFAKIREIENQHRWLKGKQIQGIADPAIWNHSTGESIADIALKYQIYFSPGDNARISGWQQIHYRFQFDENGYPMMYIFNTCKAFIRTIPLLLYSETKPEDVDTDMEDHVADETRYMCMSRPLKAMIPVAENFDYYGDDPLNQRTNKYKKYR
ncbi:phage terminase large subunit [Eubacterium sp.]|uniref:phage terminase large subunit n=1 Tax=Eubacterium sp. TaxID=142586 RepID=UPI0025D22802|nr:phage terminase large subunit [Eubacterium sp.]MCR5630111.1 phage terminase large subunit [Eubacterium sp.]